MLATLFRGFYFSRVFTAHWAQFKPKECDLRILERFRLTLDKNLTATTDLGLSHLYTSLWNNTHPKFTNVQIVKLCSWETNVSRNQTRIQNFLKVCQTISINLEMRKSKSYLYRVTWFTLLFVPLIWRLLASASVCKKHIRFWNPIVNDSLLKTFRLRLLIFWTSIVIISDKSIKTDTGVNDLGES